jgi:hypothetical protein
MAMHKTAIATFVLCLVGVAQAADDCSGEIRVGHGWDNLVRNPDHTESVCFFTYKWKSTNSRNDIPERDAMRIEEVCASAMVGNDKGMYCRVVGKFRKAKDGVLQLIKLKDVRVIYAKLVK